MNSILLLRPDKAGDLIKSLPALRALKSLSPLSQIHLLVSKANESLLKYEPGITYSVLPLQWEMLPEEELSQAVASIFDKQVFDRAISLLTDSFPHVEKLLSQVPAREKFSIFSETLPLGIWPMNFKRHSPVHHDESLNIAELIALATELPLEIEISKQNRSPILGPPDFQEVENKLGKKSGSWLAVCPFAGTANRTHPLKKWNAFIKNVVSHSAFAKILLLGAPSDVSLLEEIKRESGNCEPVVVVLPSSFRTLGAFLKASDKVIAVDSGPLHFSLALGIPSLGFLSGGDHLRWFAQVSPQDRLVPRGIFNRYPTRFEMSFHFNRWR
jgi:ADP-heptose:LPS heptosyltransferase